MRSISRLLLLFLLLSLNGALLAQSTTDSLLRLARDPGAADTSRAKAYAAVTNRYRDRDTDKAIVISEEALAFCKDRKMDSAYYQQLQYHGAILRNLGRFDDAKSVFSEVAVWAEQKKDSALLAQSYSGTGTVYQMLGMSQMAILYQMKAVAIEERLNNSFRYAAALNNLANVYDLDKSYGKAIPLYKKALSINESNNYQKWLPINYLNLANCYKNIKKYDSAFYFYDKALTSSVKVRNVWAKAATYESRSEIYIASGNYVEAQRDIDSAYVYADKAGNREIQKLVMLHDVELKKAQKRYREALELWNPLYDTIRSAELARLSIEVLSLGAELYRLAGDHEKADELYARLVIDNDSLFAQETRDRMADMETRIKLESEWQMEKMEQERKQKENEAEIRRSRWIAVFLSVIVILSLVAGMIAFRAYRQKKKSHELLESQKHVIEQKNLEILDSINYAKRIQYALLAHAELLQKNLPEYSVFFRPKDIVSGDFYWAIRKDKRFYVAVCDCTGHGVPGAFMSLLNISFLNEAITERGLMEPHQIFEHVRTRLVANISQDGGRDGMDGTLLCFDSGTGKISYCAANSAVVWKSENSITRLPYDKVPVGHAEAMESFTTHEIPSGSGQLYLFTDGFADQFGGPKGKKYKQRPFINYLESISGSSSEEQSRLLLKEFENWKGSMEQVDDVLVMHIRIGS